MAKSPASRCHYRWCCQFHPSAFGEQGLGWRALQDSRSSGASRSWRQGM